MSHIVTAKTIIKLPVGNPVQLQAAKALLRQAAIVVASQNQGGRIEDYYLDYYRVEQYCELAIITEDVFRGMAVEVDQATGELSFKGDFWGRQSQAQELQRQIVQIYQTIAIRQVLTALGYATEVQDGQKSGQLVVKGAIYA